MKEKIKKFFDKVKSSLDVVSNKSFDEKIKKNEGSLSVLFDNSHDIISIVDETAKTFWANKAWKNLFGDDLKMLNPFNKVHPDDLEDLKKIWLKLINDDEKIIDAEYRFQGLDGTYLNFQTNANKIQINNMNLILVISRNFSEKTKAEGKLKESEEKFKLLYQKTPLLNFITDIQSKIIDVNETVMERLGYTRNEIVGKYIPEFIVDKELAEAAIEQIKTSFSIDESESPEFECEVYKKDGSIATLFTSIGHTMIKDGEETHIHFSGMDITARKKAEEELKKKHEQLQRFANLSIGRERKMIELKNELKKLKKEI